MKITETEKSVFPPLASSLDLLPLPQCDFALVLHQCELISFIGFCGGVCSVLFCFVFTVLLKVYGLICGSALYIEHFPGEVPT